MKIVCFALYTAAVILSHSAAAYCVVLMFMLLAVFLARLSIRSVISPVKRLFWFFSLIFIMNLLFFSPQSAWFKFWIFAPSIIGAQQGISVVIRVLFVLIMGNVLVSTTSPISMTKAIENLIFPLSLLKIPTGQIAMILSAAIQFIPVLFEETELIRKAQTARGAKFDSRRLRDKVSTVLPLAIPVFISAFKRADELSLAMEARGYSTDKNRRTHGKIRLEERDYAALSLCVFLLSVIILLFLEYRP